MNSKSFRFILFAATSAVLVLCKFLVYLGVLDIPATRLLNPSAPDPAVRKGQVQHSVVGYRTGFFDSRVSIVQDSNPPSLSGFPSNTSAHTTLGIASQVFVLSLPRRVDRRIIMDAISHALGFDFIYVDGVEAADARIDETVRGLRVDRHVARGSSLEKLFTEILSVLGDDQTDEAEYLDPMGSFPRPLSSSFTSLGTAGAPISEVFKYGEPLDLACATPEDPFPIPLNASQLALLPPWRILSRGMIACWIGHLYIIRQILRQKLEIAIVLEDDVDLEYDISERLMNMWPALPRDGWDLVMLGTFCLWC